MVPMIETAAHAEQMVRAMKYPPERALLALPWPAPPILAVLVTVVTPAQKPA